MRSLADDRPIVSFVTVTFAFSWTVWAVGFAAFESPFVRFASVVAGAFGPMAGAATVLRLRGRSVRGWLRDALRVRTDPRWYALAVAIPLFFAAVHVAYLAVLGVPIDPELAVDRLPLVLGGIAFTFFLGGGQEEFGWRGFMLPRLQADHGPMRASVALGVVWAAWHLPLFALPGALYAGRPFATYVPVVVALALVLTWLYNRSEGAIPALMLLHAAVNNVGALIPVAPARLSGYGGGDAYHVVQFTGAATVVAAILLVDGVSLGADRAGEAGVDGEGEAGVDRKGDASRERADDARRERGPDAEGAGTGTDGSGASPEL